MNDEELIEDVERKLWGKGPRFKQDAPVVLMVGLPFVTYKGNGCIPEGTTGSVHHHYVDDDVDVIFRCQEYKGMITVKAWQLQEQKKERTLFGPRP